METIKEFCRKQDILRKLYAAVEEIEQSGNVAVFEGLQEGKTIVKLSYDGQMLHFSKAEDGGAFPTKQLICTEDFPQTELIYPPEKFVPPVEIEGPTGIFEETKPKKKSRFK